MPRRDDRTMSLLDWEPPKAVDRFEPEVVRAATLRAAFAKAVAAALRDCDRPREDVATAISEYLGEDCSKAMLDAYASEAREEHVISLLRFMALIHATGDRRLLQMLAEPMGWAVIDRKYLPAIEDAVVGDKIDELERVRAAARRRWKAGI